MLLNEHYHTMKAYQQITILPFRVLITRISGVGV